MLYTADELNLKRGDDLHTMIEDARNNEPFAVASKVNRDYAMGKFRNVATGAKTQMVQGVLDVAVNQVSENLIGQCLNEISARLRFDHYECDDDEVKEHLKQFDLKNNLSKSLIQVNKRAKTDGNAAMSVAWQAGIGDAPGRVVIRHERWWDGVEGVFLAVSDDGSIEWVVSDFNDAFDRERRTIFLPDRTLRFVKEGTGWKMFDGDRGEVIRPLGLDGNPLGIPFAHFPNGAPAYGNYGASTVGQVVPAQDALNASLLNRQLVVALTGMQIYWATGVANGGDLEVAPGVMWSTPEVGGKFGALSPGDLKALLAETEDLRSTICGEFPVPSYRLGNGQWPSGLALQRSDFPMIASAKLTGDVFEPSVVLLGHRGIELHNAYTPGAELNEDALISVVWRPADEVDPGTQIDLDQGKAEVFQILDGLSDTLVEASGLLTPKQLAQFKKERKAQREAAATIAESAPLESGADI